MNVYFAQAATSGIAVSQCFLVESTVKRVVSAIPIDKDNIEAGWTRLINALEATKTDINEKLAALGEEKENAVHRQVLESYLMMLEDAVFLKEINNEYEKSLLSIDYVLDQKVHSYAQKLKSAGNDYLAARAQDLIDVFSLVADNMQGIKRFDAQKIPQGSIVIAQNLTVNDVVFLVKRVAAFVIRDGGVYSHVMILARNYGIPTLVGVDTDKIFETCKTGDVVIVDADKKQILLSADEETQSKYKKLRDDKILEEHNLEVYKDKVALSKDGEPFEILANIGSLEDAKRAIELGAQGIGLFRTEFLFMGQQGSQGTTAHSFGEEEQFEVYKKVLEVAAGKTVTIRTLDAGGDKVINTSGIANTTERNPLMGLRAIRLSLMYPNVFKTQLRALLRASVYGKLRIMIPLVTSVSQVTECRAIIESVKQELKDEGVAFSDNIPVGVMIETAAAVVVSDRLAKICDFFSLGTNDLIQYTLGIDRENPLVSNLYNEHDLAVLRMIEVTVKTAKKGNIPLCVCGEMAGQEDCIKILGGLGIRTLSMSSSLMARAKATLEATTIAQMQRYARKLLRG